MKKSTALFLSLIISIIAISQNELKDPKATKILDNLSEKTKSYKTICSDFSFKMENQQEDITEVYEGKMKIKGDKYHLSLMGTETYCDGKTIWTYLVESEEVNIADRDLEDESFLNNPQSIFTMYQSGYKYRYKGEAKDDNGSYARIELFPEIVANGLQSEDDEQSDLSKIVILINTEINQIHSFTYYSKNGNIYTFELSNFEANTKLDDSDFTFDVSKHPDVEAIDLRD